MGSFSIWHWAVVLLIVMLIFGTKRLKTIGSDLGSAVKGFQEGMKGGDESAERMDLLAAPEAVDAGAAQRREPGGVQGRASNA